MMKDRLLILVPVLVAVTVWPAPAWGAASVDEVKAAKIKAAYLMNFVRFTTWPGDAFESPEAPIVVGLLGGGLVAEVVDRTLTGKTAGGRAFEVRRLASPSGQGAGPSFNEDEVQALVGAIGRCHVLFVTGGEDGLTRRVLGRLGSVDVLSVGDQEKFVWNGGMIQLVIREGRVVFDINVAALRRTRLRVSSKLLHLAQHAFTAEELGG